MPWKNLAGGIPLSTIAETISCKVIGSDQVTISGLSAIESCSKNAISFCTATSKEKIQKAITDNPASAFILSAQAELPEVPTAKCFLVVEDVMHTVCDLVPLFYEASKIDEGISKNSEIDSTVRLGKNLRIGSFVSIGADVIIGNNVTIHPHVTIYSGAVIGDNSTIHSGAIIREEVKIGEHSIIQNGAVVGADGFGYIPDPKIGLRHVPQIGDVVLGDRVEIGANSCIDRATLGTTSIGTSVKIDNQVQVGHNTSIGDYSILCGMVGIAGSCKIGKQTTLGAGTGIADHIQIPDGTRFAARTGVIGTIKQKGDYGGFPAVPVREWQIQRLAISLITKRLKVLKNLLNPR